MFDNDLLIKKYPFSSYFPNLIKSFSIIGYKEKSIPSMLKAFRINKKTDLPTILVSIKSNSDIRFKFNIVKAIYADNPYPLLINKNYLNQEPPPTSNVINHFFFGSPDDKEIVFHAFFAFRFYEKYKYEKTDEEYYIPKAFCIESQYCYFNLFYQICKNIHSIMSQKTSNSNSLPIELII